jgi:hypothetical protein
VSICRFERPDVVRLALRDEGWIEVKRRLSGGERRRMSAAAFTDMQQGKGADGSDQPKIGVDFAVLGLARTKAYLVDWNFRDAKDKPVKVTPAAIEALNEESLKEIEEALDTHIAAIEAESKVPSGEPASSPV